MCYLAVAAAFALFVVFDLNKAANGRVAWNGVGLIGGVLLTGATVVCLQESGRRQWGLGWIWLLTGLGISLFLLIYCLFFALPSRQTYGSTGRCALVDRGVYALCRHPGVWCLLGGYLCLAALFPGREVVYLALWINGCNLLYVCWQDCVLFPRCISGYVDYRKRTPFLFPNRESLKRCLQDLTGRG